MLARRVTSAGPDACHQQACLGHQPGGVHAVTSLAALQGGPPPSQTSAPAQQASQAPAPQATIAANSSAVVPGQEGGQLTTAMLAAANPEQQKQMLGERLFPLVSGLQVSSLGAFFAVQG